MVELACVIKIFVARLDLAEKRHQASKWTSGNYTKKKKKKTQRFCFENDMFTITEKTICKIETRFCKCSVEVNYSSMKSSKTAVVCQEKVHIKNIGISFS